MTGSPSGVPSRRVGPWGFVGMGALAGVAFLDLASVIFMPWWLVVVLAVLWVCLFLSATRMFEPHPTRVAWLALAAFALWVAAVGLTALLHAAG